mmetsp:Transcript_10214/g.16936  ORF Transcript_10214/g.16936 Transcript_10214/m.16936 type:complete len:448 (+) Transcript_10214:109-1452(+)
MAVAAKDNGASQHNLEQAVLDVIANLLNLPRSSLSLDMKVVELGIDSVRVVGLRSALVERLRCEVPMKAIMGSGKKVSDVCALILPHLQDEPLRPPSAPSSPKSPFRPWSPPSSPAPAAPLATNSIDSSARIEEGVSIGPFTIVEADAVIRKGTVIASHCVIEAGACLEAGCRVGRFTVVGSRVTLGPGTVVDTHCSLGGSGTVRIGANNRIGSHCRITAIAPWETVLGDRNELHTQVIMGFGPQDYNTRPPPAGGIVIGNDNVFRDCVSIDAACGTHQGSQADAKTQIGNSCYIMRNAHIAHDGLLEDRVVLTMNVQLAGYVRVMHHANIGVGAVVHQYSTIGPYCMIGMGTAVTRDPLPFTTYLARLGLASEGAVSVNRVGLARGAMKSEEQIDEIEAFYWADFSSLKGPLADQTSEDRWFYQDLKAFDHHRASQDARRPLSNLL